MYVRGMMIIFNLAREIVCEFKEVRKKFHFATARFMSQNAES
jgi:hypothetical protein